MTTKARMAMLKELTIQFENRISNYIPGLRPNSPTH